MPLLKEPGLLGLDRRLNKLKKDSGRCEDCNNVYLDEDILRNRPYFTGYTFENAQEKIKGLQVATFRSYATTDTTYKNYMLGYVEGGSSAPGKVLKINSIPASGTEFAESSTNASEDSSTGNYYPAHTRIHADAYTADSGMPFFKGNPAKGVLSGDVMYWLGQKGLWKYDGLMTLRAGLPQSGHVDVASSGATATRYVRSVLAYYDFSGQWVLGDYEDTAEATMTLNSKIKYSAPALGTVDLKNDGWDNGYMIIKRYMAGSVITGAGIRYELVETNLVAGDWLTVYTHNYGGAMVLKMKVHSVDTVNGYIYFYDDEIYEKDLTSDGPFVKSWAQALSIGGDTLDTTSQYMHSSIQQAVYVSNAASTGYQFVGLQSLHGLSAATIGANVVTYAAMNFTYPSTVTPPRGHPFTAAFENFYDEGVVKDNLPETDEIKYLALHGNLLLAADYQYLYYCNNGTTGSTVEDFDPLNFFPVGTPEDGPIVGLYANDDYVIVHRERQSYYIVGSIATASFRTQPFKGNKIGALSHWAQVSHAAQNFMISRKGAHVLGQGTVAEAGTLVENIIRNKDTADFGSFPRIAAEIPLAYCTIDDEKNHIYTFYRTSGPSASLTTALVLNYDKEEWFRWTLPKAYQDVSNNIVGGACAWDGRLWLSNGSDLNIENSSGGTADSAFVSAYWTSVFRTEDEPSLEKKYTYLKVFSIGSEAWDCTVEARFDWETGSMTSQATKDLPDANGQGFELYDLTARRAYALQLKISSTGYLKVDSIEVKGDVLQKEVRK
jgi:hypothetical protein